MLGSDFAAVLSMLMVCVVAITWRRARISADFSTPLILLVDGDDGRKAIANDCWPEQTRS